MNLTRTRTTPLIGLSFLGYLLFLSAPVRATDLKLHVEKDQLVAGLTQKIPSLMQQANIPGLSLAVIREGQVLWHGSFGVKNVTTREPVNPETIFEAASLTKPLFAYAVLKLVEDGTLTLDAPLIGYVPEKLIEEKLLDHPLRLEGFQVERFRKVTARQVLSHSSGLPHGERGKPYPIFFEPGDKYKYSAGGYYYLQLVVEHLKNKPLEQIIQELVLDPLEMKRSSMVWKEGYESRAAVGHDLLGETTGEFRKRTRAHAAATLYTTAEDYARFVVAVLNDAGLKVSTITEMLTPQVKVDDRVYWSLGFGIQRNPAGECFWQWGDYGIFRNYIVAFKREKIGVVYLTNSFNGLSIGEELVEQAIGSKDLGLAYLKYERYDSPAMLFANVIRTGGIAKAKEVFPQFREKYSSTFTESRINTLGYAFLNAKKFTEAIEVFKLNVEAFPTSANTYDSLAEAYLNSGDRENALKYYEMALQKSEDDPRPDKDFLNRMRENAREKLKSLKKDP
jgi:CubicO group peptidase (beta-lactamase class C family)